MAKKKQKTNSRKMNWLLLSKVYYMYMQNCYTFVYSKKPIG